MSQHLPEIRLSATVALIREKGERLEIFLARRNSQLKFMPGAWVFPGGALDPEDMQGDFLSRVRGICAQEADKRLGYLLSAKESMGLHIAGLRECFEEVGILFARQRDDKPLSPEVLLKLPKLRKRWLRGQPLADLLIEENLFLNPAQLIPWSRWVTPTPFPRRFDTLFFIARCPWAQMPIIDGGELVEGRWFTLPEALQAHGEGALPLAPPTLITLTELATCGNLTRVLAEGEGRDLRPSCPEIVVSTPGSRVLVLPGDKDHSDLAGVGIRRVVEEGVGVFRLMVG